MRRNACGGAGRRSGGGSEAEAAHAARVAEYEQQWGQAAREKAEEREGKLNQVRPDVNPAPFRPLEGAAMVVAVQ